MARLRNTPAKKILCLAWLSLLLVVGLATNLRASSRYDVGHTARFFQFDTGPVLSDPGLIKTGPTNQLAVWDRTFQRFFFHDLADSPVSDTRATTKKRKSFSQLLRSVYRGNVLSGWELDNHVQAFFDANGVLWYYDQRLANHADTFSLIPLNSELDELTISGPIKSLVPSQNQIIVQYADRDTSLVRLDPYASGSVVDSAPYRLRGDLIEFTSNGLYLTQTDNTLRSFRSGEAIDSRSFSSIKDVDVHSGSIYVLTQRGEIIRLDFGLSARFTFFLPGAKSYRSIAVRGDTVYVSADEGLFKGTLDESERSFFSQSTQVDLTVVASALPDFEGKNNKSPRLWLQSEGETTSLLVQGEENMVRSLTLADTGFTREGRISADDLATNQFQYFKVESTYWDANQYLYYFFPEERAVEKYDTRGQLVRRRKFNFDQVETLRNEKFVGAGEKYVLFSGEINDSEEGFQRNLVLFDWSGELRRIVNPVHPFAMGEYTSLETPNWDYSGGNNLYELHTGYVQIYDLYGYPQGIIDDVYRPVDVDRHGRTLYVLDLNGDRLRTFRIPSSDPTRLGLPPSDLTVRDATGGAQKTILTGRSPEKTQLSLYEYNTNTLQYQQVLVHPKHSLRYPILSDNGDTLFFFGHSRTSENWTWYSSDTVKYTARPLDTLNSVRGQGFLDPERDVLFIPVNPVADTGPRYRYLSVEGDTNLPLENSNSLKHLVKGGFAGFYGVMEDTGADVIVSGYLSRDSETAPLQWTVADTIIRSSKPVKRLLIEDDDLYVVQQISPGYSRLGRLPTGFAFDRSPGDTMSVRWMEEFRGRVTWVSEGERHVHLLLQTQSDGGKLYQWYPSSKPEYGGLQGQLRLRSPADLSGIQLRVTPGGIQGTTKQAGRFSISGIPTGYVRLKASSFEYHFAYPINVPIEPGEYTIKSLVPLTQKEELLLLEGALKFFRRGRYERAGISLSAFRELIPSGPYHRWTDGLLEAINREKGDTLAQFGLFRERPELFDPRERLSLLNYAEQSTRRLQIYQSYQGFLEPYLRRFFRYRSKVLQGKLQEGAYNASGLKIPLLGHDHSFIPVLGGPETRSE